MNDFAKQLNDILTEYRDDLNEGMEDVFEDLGSISLQKIKNASEMGGFGSEKFKNRRYSKGWAKTVEKHKILGNFKATVFNRKYYRLTHLLEFEHATRFGGRTKAFPHIAPVQDEMDEVSVTKIEEMINDIS